MLDVCRVDQCDEYIDIEEEPSQRNSSRSWCTSSDVTLGAPARTGKRGTPLRVWRLDALGLKPFRASEEMTSPTVLFCDAAISLAALKTSSSIARVVRTAFSLHQTSYIKCRPRRDHRFCWAITLVNYRQGSHRGAGPSGSAAGLRVWGRRHANRRSRVPAHGIGARSARNARRPIAQAIRAD